MSKSKVLIATNPLDHEGGVVNYFRLLMASFRSEDIVLVHIPFGSRMKHFYSRWTKLVLYPVYFAADYTRFIHTLATDHDIRVVQVNPSFIPVPLIRDAFILLGAKLFRRHVVVFFRGWKVDVVRNLKGNALLRRLFLLVYGRAEFSLVLATRFRQELIELGFLPSSVKVTTTMYDAREVLPAIDRSGQRPRLLFLGRISELKGVGEFIDAAGIIRRRGVDFECVFVGHEDKQGVMEDYKTKVRQLGLDRYIEFHGRLTGRKKFEMYSSCDIYVFPSYSEGCPNSVLEALGSGLFVVSTEVGALRDIIDEGVNGRKVPCRDSNALAATLEWACHNIAEIRACRSSVQDAASSKYEANRISAEMRDLYESLIDD